VLLSANPLLIFRLIFLEKNLKNFACFPDFPTDFSMDFGDTRIAAEFAGSNSRMEAIQ
jgi:hypothetical protein